MAAALALSLALASPPKIEIDYQEFSGLQVRVNGIHLVQGSAFQYYEEGWKRGIYSSNWRPKQIEKLPNAGLRVRFEGDNGNVVGFHTYERTMTGVKAVQEYRWRGDKAVRLENCLGLLWGPALEKGTLTVDGKPGQPMDRPFPGKLAIWDKQFAPAGGRFVVQTPYADVTVSVNPAKAILFDARGHGQDWAENRELFWLGFIDAELAPRQTLRYEVEWTFDIKVPSIPKPGDTGDLAPAPLPQAIRPPANPLPLIPAPKKRTLQTGEVDLRGSLAYDLEERHKPLRDEFEKTLWRRWDKASLPARGSLPQPSLTARIGALGLPAEGYRVQVGPEGIRLTGQDEAGLQHAFRTLAWLAQPKGGSLVIPFQDITDWPTLRFRGIHMLVGPTALAFQTKLMDAALGPLKINKVVLQCERTNWAALPGIETPITMTKQDLRELFARYRARGMEPIPLIQSLGHTYWVFANGQNLDLAINPEEAFTLDPRKDRTREMLTQLWTEAIELLQPKTIHFGLDEIDMRGIPDDPTFTTRLWTLHVPWLLDLAEKKKAGAMMWGDIMLGPGEGPDALHAKTKEEAAQRRAVLRPGTMVADWHYLDNPDPEVYNSLETFKRSGATPIAATWDRPNNIRGFALAAAEAGSPGLLQTTWAGYESSEASMIAAFDQFAAYVLAADYSWSGRQEMPNKLPYDPRTVLARLYFSPPQPVSPQPGGSLTPAGAAPVQARQIGTSTFRLHQPVRLYTPTSPEGLASPSSHSWRAQVEAKELLLAVDASSWVADNEALAQVEVLTDSGKVEAKILYGRHARAPRDPRPSLLAARSGGISAFSLPLSEDGSARKVRQITLRGLSPAGGLRLHGITWR